MPQVADDGAVEAPKTDVRSAHVWSRTTNRRCVNCKALVLRLHLDHTISGHVQPDGIDVVQSQHDA